jgi:hypothetical protein
MLKWLHGDSHKIAVREKESRLPNEKNPPPPHLLASVVRAAKKSGVGRIGYVTSWRM